MRFLVCLLFTPFALGILRWTEKGYLRLPYNLNGQYAMLRDGATKAGYHRFTRMLYVIGTGTNLMHIVDLTNTDRPSIAFTHSFDSPGDAEITDVAVCDDTIAVTIVNEDRILEGHVELFLPYTKNDNSLTQIGRIAVGPYPKSMAFTPDCSRLVVVNEGKPGINRNTGTFSDPNGSITIIIRNDNGFPPEINTNFQSFNDRTAEYVIKGVRYIFRGDQNDGIEQTFSQDLEPESIVIDNNGRFAYISLQENNAIAKLDLTTNLFTDLYPLGAKNWTNFDMDASDRDGGPNLQRHNIYSFYQPRDLKYGVINNQGYILTANTGSLRQYRAGTEGYEFVDGGRARVLYNAGNVFDKANLDQATLTKINQDASLGRLYVSSQDGKNFNQLVQYPHAFGGRSVSMWNANTLVRVYDSGDDMERESANQANGYSTTFNGDCSNGNLSPVAQADLRSDDYGVQPNALDIGTYNGSSIMVAGARTGQLFAYRIFGTAMSFQSIHRRGSTSQTWNSLYGTEMAGDGIITDIGYLDDNVSPNGKPTVYVIGSGTSSIGLYEISDDGITK